LGYDQGQHTSDFYFLQVLYLSLLVIIFFLKAFFGLLIIFQFLFEELQLYFSPKMERSDKSKLYLLYPLISNRNLWLDLDKIVMANLQTLWGIKVNSQSKNIRSY